MLTKDRLKIIFPSVVFLSTFLTYVLTMPRAIHWGDNAEYITAAATLGIPHPSGYPLYVILGKLFSLLPISTVVFRVNLLSAVAASAGLVFFYFIIKRIASQHAASLSDFRFSASSSALLSFAVCLLLAFSPLFWYEAHTAQPYALHFLIFTVLLWLTLKFWEAPKPGYLLWGSLAAGLGLSNHQMLILLLPFFAAAALPSALKMKSSYIGVTGLSQIRGKTEDLTEGVVYLRRGQTAGFNEEVGQMLAQGRALPDRSKQSRKSYYKLAAAGLLLLGLSAYLYLPLRSQADPAYQWGNVASGVGAFVDHVLRLEYGDLGFSSLNDKALYFFDFLAAAHAQFGILLWWSLFGLLALFRSRKPLLLLLLTLFLGNVGGIIILRNAPYSDIGGEIFVKYTTTSLAILTIFSGLGALEIFRMFVSAFKKLASLASLPALFVLLLVAAAYPLNFASNNFRDFRFLEDYSKSLLVELPQDAVLLVSLEGAATDSVNFSLLYQQALKKLRPDVTLAGLPQIFKSADFEELNRIMRTGTIADRRKALVEHALASPEFSGRPIYTTFLVETLESSGKWNSYSNGFAYRVLTDNSNSQPTAQSQEILSDEDNWLLSQNVYGQDLLAQYYYSKASELIQTGDFKNSQSLYIKAIETDDDPTGLDTFAYRAHREVFFKKLNP